MRRPPPRGRKDSPQRAADARAEPATSTTSPTAAIRDETAAATLPPEMPTDAYGFFACATVLKCVFVYV